MTTETKEFTNDELAQYAAYERVRARGRWNMWSPQAIQATSLTEKEYFFVMENFEELQKQFDTRKK